MQAAFNWTFWKNDLQAGVYGFAQHQYNYLDNVFLDGTPNVPASSIGVTGGVAAEFVDDTFKVNSILTLIAGVRQTNFNATISESATDPVSAARCEFHVLIGSFVHPTATSIKRSHS
jgi:hypothetical protein